MYKTETNFTISAAHYLDLDYKSKCTRVHGHNWKVTVYCQSETLDRNGMVIDFKAVKNLVQERLDHAVINDVLAVNPTAENIAKWICDVIGQFCYRVKVQETEGNVAIYER